MTQAVRISTTGASCKLTKTATTAKGIECVEVDVTLNENVVDHAYVTGELGYTEAPVVVASDEDHWPDHIA